MAAALGLQEGRGAATQGYKPGVLVGNWYEDRQNMQASGPGSHILGLGGRFEGTTTTRAAQSPEGKFGEALASSYSRQDLGRKDKCVSPGIKFTHGDPYEPPVSYMATVNQLAHGQHYIGEPRVQQYLWDGSNKHNSTVPASTLTPQGAAAVSAGGPSMTATKKAAWQWEQDCGLEDMYVTTSKAAADAVALAAAGAQVGKKTCSPRCPGGQPAQVARRPSGPCSNEVDKNYHQLKLRSK